MSKHAVLSPSKSSMWLNCTPSARLGVGYDTSNDAADEGTLAHSLGELLLKQILGRITKVEYKSKLKEVIASKHYNLSMMEHCTQFAAYVIEQLNAMQEKYGEALIILEANLDLRDYIPQGFGTGDVIIIAGSEVLVIDLKYGKGVFVHTKGNTQMMIYALGAIDLVSLLSTTIRKVRMTIYQPRLDNIDTWEISMAKLTEWANGVLKGRAKLAFAGKGKRVAGSHCLFCPVKATCAAHASYNLAIVGEEFEAITVKPDEISDAELVKIYLAAKQIRNWLSGVEDHMASKALAGKKWKGLKLVYGRSNRVITNPGAILKILRAKKLSATLYLSEPQLLGITALENNIGVKEFFKLAGKYVAKPEGKPSLVHSDGKGKDYDPLKSAIEDFS